MYLCMRVLSHVSHIQLFVTPWTVARQAPLSLGFSRQEYWSGLPRPPLGDLPNPGMEHSSYVSCTGRQIFTTSTTCVKVTQSCPTLCDPLEFFRPEYWSGESVPSPGDLPNPGIQPGSCALQVDFLPTELSGMHQLTAQFLDSDCLSLNNGPTVVKYVTLGKLINNFVVQLFVRKR